MAGTDCFASPVWWCSWQTDLEGLISGFILSSLYFTDLVVGVWEVNSIYSAELPGGCGDVRSEVTCVARDFLKCCSEMPFGIISASHTP